jgi:hypothetical protein
MKCAVEMDSVAMLYTPRFIKINSGIQKLIGGNSHAHKYADNMEIP